MPVESTGLSLIAGTLGGGSGGLTPRNVCRNHLPRATGEVRAAFLKRNRGMTADGLNVRVNKENRLTEVWVCMDLKFKLAACRGGNGTPDDVAVVVTPKR